MPTLLKMVKEQNFYIPILYSSQLTVIIKAVLKKLQAHSCTFRLLFRWKSKKDDADSELSIQ